MISKTTIDSVYETARVEEVIGDFIMLKRAGSNFKGFSPFSDERSPSFMVSPAKGIWKDFSSGKGGNAIAFVMEHEKYSYPEAIKYLAKKYNIEVEETAQTAEEKANTDVKESLFLVSEYAKNYFHNSLLNSEEGKSIGLAYFKERGFSNETIKKFHLGYSPEGWNAFTKEALEQGYKLEFLEVLGLTIPNDNKPFDRFKGRVIFPIQSMSGRILGFGGRILNNDKKIAKYLNSPESELYHKSKILYGLFQAKQSIAKLNNCYLVEGYTDVIQLHQAGIENVVSSSGTALSSDQVRLINRLTKNITVLFDSDAAGLSASIRGIDLILEEGMNVKICGFPDGEDPDSFAKKITYENLKKYLDENSKDFIQFKASLLIQNAKNDPIKKADLIREMVVSISKIPDRIKREIYVQECSKIMDISEQVLLNTLAQLLQKEQVEIEKKFKQDKQILEIVKNEGTIILSNLDVIHSLEKSLLQILLLYGNQDVEFENIFLKLDENQKEYEIIEKVTSKIYQRIYLNLQEDEIKFSNPLFKEIYDDLVLQFFQNEQFDSKDYLKISKKEYVPLVTDIFMDDEKYQLHGWMDKKQVFVKDKNNEKVLNRLVTETILTYREYLINKINSDLIQNTQPETDTNILEVMDTINEYNKLKVSISRNIGRMRSNKN